MPKLRIDRAFSIGVARPWKRITQRSNKPAVPILMYHGIQKKLDKNQHPYFETNTYPELFAQHMQFLHESGYKTVTVQDAVSAAVHGQNGHKLVAITFDDGFADFYTHAFPVLAQYQMTATMYLVSDWTREQRFTREEKEFLTWPEIREMQAHGIHFGSHTVSHPTLYSLDASELEFEIRRSKESIENKLGKAVHSFAYPYAFPEQDRNFTQQVRGFLQSSGYRNGVTTILGTANPQSDAYFLPRLPVNSHDDLTFFKAKLEGGYDWLHSAQYLSKTVKRIYRGRQ